MRILTLGQRNALDSPSKGLLIWNSTDAKLEYFNGTGWEVLQSVGGGGGSFAVNTITADSYTIQSSDNGKLLYFTHDGYVDVTVPVLSQGFYCSVVQGGTAGSVVLSGSVAHRVGHNATGGQYGRIEVVNTDGTNFVISGDSRHDSVPTGTAVYPPQYDSTYIVASDSSALMPAHDAIDPANSGIGDATYNAWRTGFYNGNVRFVVDFNASHVIKTLRFHNYHHWGASTNIGIKDFKIYGSIYGKTSITLTYGNATNIVHIFDGTANKHGETDVIENQQFILNNNTAYRSMIVDITNNHGNGSYMGIRHMSFLT